MQDGLMSRRDPRYIANIKSRDAWDSEKETNLPPFYSHIHGW